MADNNECPLCGEEYAESVANPMGVDDYVMFVHGYSHADRDGKEWATDDDRCVLKLVAPE